MQKFLLLSLFIVCSRLYAKETNSNDYSAQIEKSTEKILDIAKSGIETTIDAAIYPWIFAGFDIGKSSVQTYAKGEVDMNGSYRAVRGNVLFYYSLITLEAGGGYFFTILSGKDDSRHYKQSAKVATTFLDGSARFRFGTEKSFEFGFTNQVFFGSQSDFGPIEGANDKNYYYGLSATYQSVAYRNIRVIFQYLKDYTIKTRDVSFISLGLQYGLPLRGNNTDYIPPAQIIKPVEEKKKVEYGDGTLQIFVASTPGIPLKDVSYELKDDNKTIKNGVIKNGDHVEFKNFPSGNYLVHVNVEGYKPEKKEIVISKKNITNVFFKLVTLNELEVKQSFDFGTIKFKPSSAELTPDASEALQKVVDVLKENMSIRLLSIEGHTDSSGDATKNVTLSKNRAKSVTDYLIAKGIEKSRLKYEGFGPNRPLVKNDTPENRAKNRRVEFIVEEIRP